MNLTTIATKEEAQKALAELGVTGQAAEHLITETIPFRHELRIEQVKAVLFGGLFPSSLPRISALAYSNAKKMNIGSQGVVEDPTTRILALTELGEAWPVSLVSEAAERIKAEDDDIRRREMYRDAEDAGTLNGRTVNDFNPEPYSFSALPEGLLCFGDIKSFCDYILVEGIPAEWRLTIAREGLRRAAGLDAWYPEVSFDTGPEMLLRWNNAVNSLEKDIAA